MCLGGERVEAGHRVQGIFRCFLSCSEPQQPGHDIAAAVAGVCGCTTRRVLPLSFRCCPACLHAAATLGARVYITCCLAWPCQGIFGNHQLPMGRSPYVRARAACWCYCLLCRHHKRDCCHLTAEHGRTFRIRCKHAGPSLKAVWWVSSAPFKNRTSGWDQQQIRVDIEC